MEGGMEKGERKEGAEGEIIEERKEEEKKRKGGEGKWMKERK